MTAPLRQQLDSFVGTIQPVPASGTVLQCDKFPTLPPNLSPAWYVPAEIVDDSTGAHETVRIVGSNGTTSATVLRGMEGTARLDWNQPVTIRCAPAIYDATMVIGTPGMSGSLAAVPNDLHVGARYITGGTDGESFVREQTLRQGALPTVRGAAADMPRSLAGAGLHYRSLVPRLKAIAFGPVVTSSFGSCGVYWDGVGNPASFDTMVTTEKPALGYVAACLASALLFASSGAWAGHIVPNYIGGPNPWLVQLLCFKPDGSRLANQQVAGSLLVVGG